jgi:5-methylcytosine-specific restriction protein A
MWQTPSACPVCRKPSALGSRYCADHPRENERRYDREEREPWHRWYGLSVWKRLRLMKLHRNPICEKCNRYAATDVHHRIDHKGDWRLFLTLENLESLCHSCHSRITAQRNAQTGVTA